MTSVNNETYITSMNEIITKCKTPCEKRPMMGRSWWKQFGYNSPCSCAHEAHEAYEKKEAEWKQKVIKNCIKRIEKAYKITVIITDDVMEEINSVYDKTSGCSFMNWLNHRLYIYIMTDYILNDLEYPEYKDWEDLEDIDSDDEN
jgi:hypothetical protein